MSDSVVRRLAGYAARIGFSDLSAEVVHEVKRRIADSVGCALAAFHAEPVQASRHYAERLWVDARSWQATLWGTGMRTVPELAGFVNGIMIRYLDYNDTYLSLEPLHPSDVIGALVAVGEAHGCSPRDLITAIAVAYEVGVTLCDAASLRKYRWDHVNYIGIATACGLGNLLKLSPEQIAHAISIAIVPHAAMRQTRAGELSMWKGAAASNSARNAVFATYLAMHGFTGPYAPFEGEMGFFQQLLGGERFREEVLKGLSEGEAPRRILDTYIKFWPVEYHAQSAVDAALQLYREELKGDSSQIDHITIETFKAAYEIIAKDPEKWSPQTRETADHSLPYIVVVALEDGEVTEASFTKERIFRESTRAMLKDRVTLREDPELTAGYPDGIPNRITVQTKDGKTYVREVRYPRGHAKNPMTDEEVYRKFMRNLRRVNHQRIDELWQLIMELDRQEPDLFWERWRSLMRV